MQDVQLITWLVAISGWAKLAYDYIVARPRIVGTIIVVWRGQLTLDGKNYALFAPYLYLTNQRKASVHVWDIEMRVCLSGKWVNTCPIYNAHVFSEGDFIVEETTFRKWPENQLRAQNKGVDFGSPVQGWAVFVSENLSLVSAKIDAYEVVCVDAFRKPHKINTRNDQLDDIKKLQSMGLVSFKNEIPTAPPEST